MTASTDILPAGFDRRRLAILTLLTGMALFCLTLPVAQVEEFMAPRLPSGDSDLMTTAKGFFSTAHFLAYIPFAFIWGALSDRMGKRKPILMMGLLGQAVMFVLIPFIYNLPLLYAARFIEGAFSIASVSMLMTLALDIAPNGRRGMVLGFFSTGMLLGSAFGAPLGGVLGQNNTSLPFWLAAALLAGCALVAFIALAESRETNRATSLGSALALLREEPRLYVPYLFSFLDRLTVGFYVGIFSVLAAQVYGFTPGQRGAYLSVFLLFFALLSPLGGILSDRFGRVRPLLAGTIVYGLMLLLVGSVSPGMLYVVMAVGGIAGAVLYPPSIALTGDLAGPAQRGVAMAGFNLAGSVGYAVGPLLFGFVADTFGILSAPLAAGVICLLAVSVAAPLLLRRRGRLEAEAAA